MFLGLDLGTSALKVIVYRDTQIIAQTSTAYPMSNPKASWVEQDPALWTSALNTCLMALRQTVNLGDVIGVGLTGQMHGLVTLDRYGKLLRPAILWNDNRAVAQAVELNSSLPNIGMIAGIPALPSFPAVKMRWIKQHEPEIFTSIHKVLMPKDYIGFCLHGAYVTDHSDAAASLWYDQTAQVWSEKICAASDTRLDQLPDIRFGHQVAGHITASASESFGLPKGIPVFAGAGDCVGGAIALGAVKPGRGLISIGTSGQLWHCLDHYAPQPDRFVHAFSHALPNRWYQMAAMLNGARPLAWLGETLGQPVADLLTKAQNHQGHVPTFLPYMAGERSPHGNPALRGGFLGLDTGTTDAAMARAVVDAIAFSFADCLASFGDTAAAQAKLFAIGGGAQSDFICQTVSNATGLTFHRTDDAAAGAALGAAKLAAFGAGAIDMAALEQMPASETTFEPKVDDALMRRYERFKAAFATAEAYSQIA